MAPQHDRTNLKRRSYLIMLILARQHCFGLSEPTVHYYMTKLSKNVLAQLPHTSYSLQCYEWYKLLIVIVLCYVCYSPFELPRNKLFHAGPCSNDRCEMVHFLQPSSCKQICLVSRWEVVDLRCLVAFHAQVPFSVATEFSFERILLYQDTRNPP